MRKKYKFIFTLIFFSNTQTLNILENMSGYFLFTTDTPIVIDNKKLQFYAGTLYANNKQQITILLEIIYSFKFFTSGFQIEIDSLNSLPYLSLIIIINTHIFNMHFQILFRGNKASISIIYKVNKYKIGIEFYFDPSTLFQTNKLNKEEQPYTTKPNPHPPSTPPAKPNPLKTQIDKPSTLTQTNTNTNINTNQLKTTLSLISNKASTTELPKIQKIIAQFDLIFEIMIVNLKNNKYQLTKQAPLLLIIMNAGQEQQLTSFLTEGAQKMLHDKRTWTTYDSKGKLYEIIEKCAPIGLLVIKPFLCKESLQLAENIANFSKTGNILIIEAEDSLERAITQNILNESTNFINSLKKISKQLPTKNENIIKNIKNIENNINHIIGNNEENILTNLVNLRYAQLSGDNPKNRDCIHTLNAFKLNIDNSLKNIIDELNKIPNLSKQTKNLIKSTLTINFNTLQNQQLPNIIHINHNIDQYFKAQLFEYIDTIDTNILYNKKQLELYNLLFLKYNEQLKHGLHIDQNHCQEQLLVEKLQSLQEYIYVNPINQILIESLDTINYKFSTYTMKILSKTDKPITQLFFDNLRPKLENSKKIIIKFFEELNKFLNPKNQNIYLKKLIDLNSKDILFLYFIRDIKETNTFFELIANLLNAFNPLLNSLSTSITIQQLNLNFQEIFNNLIIAIDKNCYEYYNNPKYNELLKKYTIMIHQGINKSNMKRNIQLKIYNLHNSQYFKNDEYDKNYTTSYKNEQKKYSDYMQYRKIINELISFKKSNHNPNNMKLKILNPELLTIVK